MLTPKFVRHSLAPIALAAVVSCLATDVWAETLDELYEKAKAEKSLVFYAGGPAVPHENRVKEFQQRFPGIAVSVTGGFSNVLNAKINQQMRDGKLETDMAFFQTVQDFVTWKRQGKLLAFKPDGFEQIMPNLRDEDGAYMAVSANPLTYAYNTKLLRPEDAPKSALDFLKPVFAGKLISVYPHDDDAALYLFYLIVQKYGWDYMAKYMANKPNFIQGHLPVARSVASGENIATLDASSAVWPFKRAGQPVEVAFSGIDETPIYTLTGGIFKDAPHPNAAKLYLSFFLSRDQQTRLGMFSSRIDMPPPEGFRPLTSYKIANNFREFMLNDSLIADLRKRMESYVGPVLNQGGVR